MLLSTGFARLLVALSLALAIVGTTAVVTAAAPAERQAALDVAFQDDDDGDDDDGGGNGTSGVGQIPATGSGPLETKSHAGELFAAIVATTMALAAGVVWRWRARLAC